MQTTLTKNQVALLHTQCPVCSESELTAMDSIAPDAPYLYCSNCETTIDGNGTIERGIGTTEYMNIPDVCPSSLNEWGWPLNDDETAHKWDETTTPHTCAECGAIREGTTPIEAIALLNNQILHTDGDDHAALFAYQMAVACIKTVYSV